MFAFLPANSFGQKKVLLAAFFAVMSFLNAAAQQEINFSSFTTRDGLSSNTVNAILKDRYGMMWFATDDGLDRFDGNNITIYRNRPGDSASLQANEILALHEDARGNLWIGTSGGSLSLYDRKLDRFIHFPFGNGPNAINNNVIMGICSDREGRIWIATYSGINILDMATNTITRLAGPDRQPFSRICISLFQDEQQNIWIGTTTGLFCYHSATKELKAFIHQPGDPQSLPGNIIAAIAQDKKGNIWIGSDEGLSELNADGNSFTQFRHSSSNPVSLSNNTVRTLAFSPAGELWIGTARGLNIFENTTAGFKRISHDYHNTYGISSQEIRVIYMDKDGISWLGTTRGGINKYDRNINLFTLVKGNPFDRQGLNAEVITCFVDGNDGKVFVGTEGEGLMLFDPATKLFRRLNIRSKRKNAESGLLVLSAVKTGKDELLMGTNADGLFIMNTANGSYRQMLKGNLPGDLNSNDIYCVTADSKRNRWVGTNGAGINVLDSNNKLIYRLTPSPKSAGDRLLPLNGFIRDIAEDHSGMIWIATHGGGIAQYNPLTGVFHIFTTANSRLPNDKVQTVLVDHNGNVWAGSFGAGLAVFDRSTRQFTTYNEKDGLQNNTVYKILEDNNGLLWLSTNKGLSSIHPVTKKISNYNFYHGLLHNSFTRGAGLCTAAGLVFFGGIEGFNYFRPSLLKKNTLIPKVLLTDLKVANQQVVPDNKGILKENISVASTIYLDYRQNFMLSYVALDYSVPGQHQYAYKLEGYEKDWNYVGAATSASYTNLDPGNYIFRVKAGNNDAVWSSSATSIKIIVQPPFWRTIYAWFFYLIFIIFTALYIRQQGIKKIKRKLQAAQEKREAARIHETDQQKIKFLTNLSHEFRTPISLILGPVDRLLTQEKNSWQAAHLQLIKRNGKRLLNLVNQLLDFRKMEEHELRLQQAPGDLVAFTEEVFDAFRDIAERRQIEFSVQSAMPVFNTLFDHDKMERILFNLLSNAFKFTPQGGSISLSMHSMPGQDAPAKQHWVGFCIADSGTGIPADSKEKIFERFFQVPSGTAILNQGTGIGLSITREFVTMHGGKIEVESAPGKGSLFSVYIPFPTDENSFTSPVQSNDIREQAESAGTASSVYTAIETLDNYPEETNGKAAVLLVEDNDDFRYFLKESLSPFFKVLEASNGKEGWQTALARHPQLIVSDISMPCMDGIELCRKLKADRRTNHIPVILLTALTGDQAQLQGLQTGASDYITKPFNTDVLLSKIKNLLALQAIFKRNYSRKIDLMVKEPAVESEDEKLLSAVVAYLEENLTDAQVSVEKLSRHIGMSRSSLYSRLLDITGQTPVEFIRTYKLEKAAVLLEKSDMNVAHIAYAVGFATPNYFAKSFRSKYDLLPSEYIKRMRKPALNLDEENTGKL